MKHNNRNTKKLGKQHARYKTRTKISQPISKAKDNIKSLADRCKKFIYNYSDYNITPIQIVALSRGFKFIPTPKMPHRSQILEDFHELARKMRMRYIMRNKRKKHHVFKLPSKWDPSTSQNTVLEEYLDETLYELSKIKRIKPISNMSKAEKIALNELKNNKSIVIKPIDKGKACAIVSREQYTAEAQRQLSAFHYQKVDHDWTSETCTLVDDLVEDLFDNKIISKETREYLLTSNRIIKVPSLYLLVKAHKAKPENTAFAGRCIISGVNAPTKYISEYLDYFLLPIVQQQETYLKDSPELIKKLANLRLPADVLICTMDVTSLYTNIDQEECVDIITKRLEETNIKYKLPKPPKPFVKRILELILKRNCFEFDGEFYIQTWGVAMGNIASPEISDLVMYGLEKEFILTDPNILYYARYRDDLLILYQPRPNELANLISKLNRCHKTLKFTSEISDQQVTFLDLQIFKGPNFEQTGILDHRVNQKATDTHQWLDPTSAHCPSVFQALVKGETLRYLRGNTIESEFINKVNFFTDKLVERSYNRDEVNEITSKIKFENRNEYLTSSKPAKEENKKSIPLVFITTYTPHIRKEELRAKIVKHWHKIENHRELSKLFPKPPIMAYKRARNLADTVISSKLPAVETPAVIKQRPPPKSSLSHGTAPASPTQQMPLTLDNNDRELLQCLVELANE